MNSTTLGVFVTIVTSAFALGLMLQLVDVVTGHQVRRAGRAAGSRDRDRGLAWTITLCSIAAVTLIVGVNFAVFLIGNSEPLSGLLLLVALSALAAVVALLAARALRRPLTGYQVIRDELRALPAIRMSRGRLADYRRWVETLDARQNDLSKRVALGRFVRAIPPLLALLDLAAIVWLATLGEAPMWAPIVFVVPLAITGWLAFAGARISLARNLALNAVHAKLRAEAIVVLDDLERKAPRKVSGLTERVSRALAILREQQGQETQSE
ncbi:MAG: hypothetical protein ABIW81_05355 [Terrimesophilobacter sp.]